MSTPTLLPDIDSEDDEFYLVKLMDKALDAVVNVYENAGVSLPPRRLWVMAGVAADCEQLTISLIQAYHGTPGEQIGTPTRCDGARTYTIAIKVLRCIPTIEDDGSAPTPNQIQTAAARQAVDM